MPEPSCRPAGVCSAPSARWGAPSPGWRWKPHARALVSLLLCLPLGAIVHPCLLVQAQAQLGADPARRPEPLAPWWPSPAPSPPLPRPVLPPVPPVSPEEAARVSPSRIFVRQILVTGSTVFAPEALARVTEAYVQRFVTSEELEALRLALTRLYVQQGYITSGAVLPDQTITQGVITYQIIEGALTEVLVEGQRWFREGYLRQRLSLGVEPPLNLDTVQDRLQQLQQDDRIMRLDAEIRPGIYLGESALHVRVEEAIPFLVAVEFNNHQSPTVGAERGLLTVAHRNLTGHGDSVSVTYGRSAGLDLQLDTGYTLPFNRYDTTVSLRYRRNSASVVEARFAPLDIASRSDIVTVTLRHPFVRTLSHEFAVALSGERLASQTFLLGEPFAFSAGTPQGKAVVTAVRLAAEWTARTPRQVLALRARVSLGVDAFGATINEANGPTGRFITWLGQVQWGRRLSVQDIELLGRVDVQLTTASLLPLEQLAVGGRWSVRGYRENQLVRDNGVIAAVEARLPLVRNTWWAEVLQVVPFIDVGGGWPHQGRTPDPPLLASLGLGLRWSALVNRAMPLRMHGEVFWGYQLKPVATAGGDLQDRGLHVQWSLTAF